MISFDQKLQLSSFIALECYAHSLPRQANLWKSSWQAILYMAKNDVFENILVGVDTWVNLTVTLRNISRAHFLKTNIEIKQVSFLQWSCYLSVFAEDCESEGGLREQVAV